MEFKCFVNQKGGEGEEVMLQGKCQSNVKRLTLSYCVPRSHRKLNLIFCAISSLFSCASLQRWTVSDLESKSPNIFNINNAQKRLFTDSVHMTL